MKWLSIPLVLAALALPARAEVFNTGRTLKPGAYSVAGELMQHLAPSTARVEGLYFGIGLVRRLDLGVRFGLDVMAVRPLLSWGADLELALLQEGRDSPALSLAVGAHGAPEGRAFADVTLVVSKVVHEHLEPFVALDADLGIAGTQARQVRAVVGLDVPIVQHFELLAEAGLGLTAGTPTYVSAGFNFYH